MKKALALLLVLVSMLSLAACVDPASAAAKDFSCSNMTITLTEAFHEENVDGYTRAYVCDGITVFVLEEKTAGTAAASWSLDDYAQAVRNMNASRNPGEITTEDGLTFFEYNFNDTDENAVYSYFTTMFQTEGAFWLVQFACDKGDWETYRPHFVEWAKTVKFAA